MKLGIYKVSQRAESPTPATNFSACFDIKACLHKELVKAHSQDNIKFDLFVVDDYISIPPFCRVLIPTGIIFVIPVDRQIKILPRSGLAWKNGITVINSPGTIDPDYTEETFVLLHNTSSETFIVHHGDRIAQGELVKNNSQKILFYQAADVDVQSIKNDTNRNGGFGSSGV